MNISCKVRHVRFEMNVITDLFLSLFSVKISKGRGSYMQVFSPSPCGEAVRNFKLEKKSFPISRSRLLGYI